MRIRIGDLLVKAGVITPDQLKSSLVEQAQWGGKLGDILVRMEFLTEEVLVRALSKQSGIPRADLTGPGDPGALEKVPPDVAEEFGVVPMSLQDDGRTLVVAMSDPLNLMVTDHLRSLTDCRIVAQLAGTSAIRTAISRWYRGEELMGDDPNEPSSIRIMGNSGNTVVTMDARSSKRPPAPRAEPAPSANNGASRPASHAVSAPPPLPATVAASQPSAVEVLRAIEATQRRSVGALKAMVELLIEKGVFSREEYLSRVKR